MTAEAEEISGVSPGQIYIYRTAALFFNILYILLQKNVSPYTLDCCDEHTKIAVNVLDIWRNQIHIFK